MGWEKLLRKRIERMMKTIEKTARQNKRKSFSNFELLADPSKLRYKKDRATWCPPSFLPVG